MEIEKMTFEEAIAKLETIVKKLEEGNLSLEKSLQSFAEGVTLTKFCHTMLEEAENKISLLCQDKEGDWIEKNLFSKE